MSKNRFKDVVCLESTRSENNILTLCFLVTPYWSALKQFVLFCSRIITPRIKNRTLRELNLDDWILIISKDVSKMCRNRNSASFDYTTHVRRPPLLPWYLFISRVVLNLNVPPESDYIHANWVKMEHVDKAFIATQVSFSIFVLYAKLLYHWHALKDTIWRH